jgi:hypothetical protein
MTIESRRITYAILNLVGFLGTLVLNGLANALPLGGKGTGELSDLYPNLFVPAGLTFSIWALIYLLLAAFIVYQLVLALRKETGRSGFLEDIGILFFISSLANLFWIVAWHYEHVITSLLLMLLLLTALLKMYLSLRVGLSDAEKGERYLVHLPLSVYLGWITVATIANVTAVLVNAGWGGLGFSEQIWTVLVLIVGTGITLGVVFTRKDIYYALVVVWAYAGIVIKRTGAGVEPAPAVVIAAACGLGVMALASILQLIRRKVY